MNRQSNSVDIRRHRRDRPLDFWTLRFWSSEHKSFNRQDEKMARFERAALFAITLLAFIPMLYPPIPPLADLPGHMGRFAVAQLIGSDPFISRFYQYHWRPIGNLGVDIPVFFISRFTNIELATKLVVSCIPPLTALGILLTYRAVHGCLSTFSVLAVFPIYSMPFHAGFVNFALGTACGWLGVWIYLKLDLLSWPRNLILVAIGALLWCVHALSYGLFVAITFGLELGRAPRLEPTSLLRSTARIAPLLLLPVIMQIFWMAQFGATESTAGWFEWRDKVSAIMRALEYQDRTLGVAALAAIAAYTFLISSASGLRIHLGMATASLLLATIFLIFPHVLMQSWAADQRIAPTLITCCLLAVAPIRKVKFAFGGAVLLFSAWIGVWTLTYARLSDELTTFLALTDAVPYHAKIAYLYVDVCDPYAEKYDPRTKAVSLLIGRKHVFTSQWNLRGVNLMHVNYPEAGPFQDLTYERVRAARCGDSTEPSVEEALERLPRTVFSYLIVDGPGAVEAKVPALYRVLSSNRKTTLYIKTNRSE